MDYKKTTLLRRHDIPSRIITLGEIDESTANEVIYSLYEINEFDKKLPNVKREPIKLIINSKGGDVNSGLGIIDAMEISSTPIDTICHGSAMSMAFPIFLTGKYRIISRNSVIMYHQLEWELDANLNLHKLNLKESDRLQGLMDKVITTKSSVTQKKLNSQKNKSNEWYITPEESIKLKIAHKII